MEVRAFGPLPAAKTGLGLWPKTRRAGNDACLLSRGWRCRRRAGRRSSSRKRTHEPSDPQQRALVSEMLREETEEGILQAVEQLREGNFLSRVHDYTSVVIAFSRKHYWERACDVLSEMHYRSLAAKPVAYNNAMSACLSRENWQQPLRLLREMRERAVPCDLFSYTNALTASGRMGMWQEALRLLWNMVGDKVAPDIVAFNAALAACESAGRWQWSLQLTKALGQAKLQPDDVTYRSITRALEAAEQQLRELRLELHSPVAPGEPSQQGPAQLHYCLVQCDAQGLEGWSLAAGSKHRRWAARQRAVRQRMRAPVHRPKDTLLLGLLQCFMMDGQWLRNVAASLLVGPDAIHATGALQRLVMTVLGQGQDGRPFYQPATLKAFEEALWKRRGQDAEGLCWQRAPRRPKTRLEAQGMLLESLDELVGEAPAKAGVLVFDAGAALTYDELQESGWTGSYDKLFVVLGGAHGFDGADDVDGRFLGEVLGRFGARVGAENVAKVTLTEDASPSAAITFPLSKVVSFISVEHGRGTLFASKRAENEKGSAAACSRPKKRACISRWGQALSGGPAGGIQRERAEGVPRHLPAPTPPGLRDFVLGLVLAVSGGGKTRSLQALRRERGLGAEDGLDLRDETLPPVADPRFASAEAAVSRLSAAGLSSGLRVLLAAVAAALRSLRLHPLSRPPSEPARRSAAMALRRLVAASAVAVCSARLTRWESHGELMDEEALKEKAVSQDLIDAVNSAEGSTWTAGENIRFAGATLKDAKILMGTLQDLDGSVLPYKAPEDVELPAEFDWRTDPRAQDCPSLKEVRDQADCGSCWAFGSVEAMTDRVCIASKGQKKIHLSAEDVTSCCNLGDMGCNGGIPSTVYTYYKSVGIVDGGNYGDKSMCYSYQMQPCAHHSVSPHYKNCTGEEPTPSCARKCVDNGADWSSSKHYGTGGYSVCQQGSGTNCAQAMMQEIYSNGPITGMFFVHRSFLSYKSGVYKAGFFFKDPMLGGHAIKILGWGTENGTPYWLVANSWNADWGDHGFFKIERGTNQCQIENPIINGGPVAGQPKLHLEDGALLDDFGAFTASGQTQAAAAALSRFVRSQVLDQRGHRKLAGAASSAQPRSASARREAARLALVEERFDFRSQTREEDLPGLGIVFGPSGSGKTTVLQAFQEMKASCSE
ncbi:Ctsb [Symbiodinium microadriaticum]|nr:Ctsb [Symbiodinium microadriaticum]